MQSSLDYAGFAQLCARSPIMRAHNRIIQRSLIQTSDSHVATLSKVAHTHSYLTAFFPGLPTHTRKVKPIWILLKQETVSGSGISWAICKSAPRSRHNHASTPPLNFLQARCPSCCPTNSIKALKVLTHMPVIVICMQCVLYKNTYFL